VLSSIIYDDYCQFAGLIIEVIDGSKVVLIPIVFGVVKGGYYYAERQFLLLKRILLL